METVLHRSPVSNFQSNDANNVQQCSATIVAGASGPRNSFQFRARHAVRNSERFLDCLRPISEPGEPFFPLFRALALAGAPPQFFDLAAAFVGRYVFARLREKRTANKTLVRRRFIQSKEHLLPTILWNLIP